MSQTSRLIRGLSGHIACVLRSLDDPHEASRQLVKAVKTAVPCKLGYAFLSEAPPRRALYLYPGDAKLPDGYAEELFVFDPFYDAYQQGKCGSLLLRNTMPPDFEQTEYFKRYYTADGIVDEILHMVRISDRTVFAVGLARTEDLGRFNEQEQELHAALFPMVESCAQQIVRHVPDWKPGDAPPTVRDALDRFGSECLTPREQQVVGLVLRGHSTQSVASRLAIAPDTVKLHRKHAYAKLRVNSQGELFYKFLEMIGLD